MSTTAVPDDSYPEAWFPGTARANAKRQREDLRRKLEELPDEILARALQEAQKLTGGPGGDV
jgi:hypothetical protein